MVPRPPGKVSIVGLPARKALVSQRIDFLDPIRGVAILLVFLLHCLTPAFHRDLLTWNEHWFLKLDAPYSFLPFVPFAFGQSGVAVFFVVSGFCIHLSFCHYPNWSVFLRRRFFRIYPPYLAALLFFALLYPSTRLHFASRSDLTQLASHLVLLHNFDPPSFCGIVRSFWSIPIEVQLYAIYPLLIALTLRFGWKRTLIGLAVWEILLRAADGILLTAHGSGLPDWLRASPFMFWFSWGIGALLAEFHLQGRTVPIGRPALFGLAAISIASCCFRPLCNMSFLLFACLTAGVIARFLHHHNEEPARQNIFWRHLQKVGVCSYSLYLFHQPLVETVPRLAAKINPSSTNHPFLIFFLCASSWFVLVPLAKLSYRFCELPSIAFGKLLHARKDRPALPLMLTEGVG